MLGVPIAKAGLAGEIGLKGAARPHASRSGDYKLAVLCIEVLFSERSRDSPNEKIHLALA
jgi:hypothetical protein